MIMGVGVGAYEGGVAHFFTHAFFKAQLFLGVGHRHPRARQRAGRSPDGRPAEEDAVRVLGDADRRALDLRRSRLQRILLQGQVIYGALAHGHPWLYAVGVLTAGITAYYMFRLLFITFLGEYRGEDARAHRHAPTRGAMNVPGRHPGRSDRCDRRGADGRRRQLAVGALLRAALRHAGALDAGCAAGDLRDAHLRHRAGRRRRLRGRVAALRNARPPSAMRSSGCDGDRANARHARESLLLRRGHRCAVRAPGAVARGAFSGACSTRMSSTERCARSFTSANWLGTLVRSFQTGLVRAYALILVFGAACFIVYYALERSDRTRWRSCSITILLPIVAAGLLLAAAARAIASCRASSARRRRRDVRDDHRRGNR